jgi:hypothetical protein
MRSDLDAPPNSGQVLEHARQLIEASRRSLAEGSKLVQQCRDIIQHAHQTLPLKREMIEQSAAPHRNAKRSPSPKGPNKRKQHSSSR